MIGADQVSITALAKAFDTPPRDFQPVPFWWWTGETLDLDRLAWELDQLCANGISSAVISYNHYPDGAPDLGDPPVYSPAWWELLREVLALCDERGMTLGFQDYCLLKPRLAQIALAHPEVRGAQLRHIGNRVVVGQDVAITAPAGARILEVTAFPHSGESLCRTGHMDLLDFALSGQSWTPQTGVWTVITCYASPSIYDPLHPQSGQLALQEFYGQYERNLPGAFGNTLTISFQDELDFGGRFPLWSDGLPDAFLAEKDYPLTGRLAELFISLDAQTPKFRMDFQDVSSTLAERYWFEPVYRWHEERGLLFGHDNAGRGAIAVGGAFYGDTMRAMRWYSAPGSDDPNLNGPRAFKGIKVASSIAHLYQRPRVWAECFHSSGWGVTPAKVRNGINALFALGATVINLHGLYYSTLAGWWEWAPPDFHFRQPYWRHTAALNSYVARLSWALAQGVHICDVAVFYPSEAVAVGLNARAGSELSADRSLSEMQRSDPDQGEDLAEALTFAVGKELFDNGVDFDFVDSASLARSISHNARLAIGECRYRVIVLAEATAIPWAAFQAIVAFSRAGGRVIIVGRPPIASDRSGAKDPELDALVTEVMSRAELVTKIGPDLASTVLPVAERSLMITGGPAHVLHRRVGSAHLIFVYNARDAPAAFILTLPDGVSAVERWFGETGASETYPICWQEGHRAFLDLRLEASGAALFVAHDTLPRGLALAPADEWGVLVDLSRQLWRSTVIPTLDNRYADFQEPASAEPLYPTCGRMWSWRPADAAAERPPIGPAELDPACLRTANWTDAKPGLAPRMALAGPFPPETDLAMLDKMVLAVDPMCPIPITVGGAQYPWRDYSFSFATGIDQDPVQKSWESGPHGLKGIVPDEFIDLQADRVGAIFYLITTLWAPQTAHIDLVASSRAAHAVFWDGVLVISQPLAMPPGVRSEWRLPHYDATPRTWPITVGPQGQRLAMRIVQPDGQRIRAYVAPAAPKQAQPHLRWFCNIAGARFRLGTSDAPCVTWFKLRGPPGLRAIALRHSGEACVWVAGQEALLVEASGGDVKRWYGLAQATRQSTEVFIGIVSSKAWASGDLITEPVQFKCEEGEISLGDWTRHGLEAFSGSLSYKTRFHLSEDEFSARLAIDIGDLAATCEIRLNGNSLGFLIGSPWRLELGNSAVSGENEIEIIVANTLANFYAYNRPTPYASIDDTRSGLFGPVCVLRHR